MAPVNNVATRLAFLNDDFRFIFRFLSRGLPGVHPKSSRLR
jgi:hypothetical protein